MSVSYLLFLFLCISLHACNARCPRSLDQKNIEKKTIHLSIKNDSISNKNFLNDLSPKQLGPRNEGEAEKPKIMGTMRSKERVLKVKVKVKGKAASGSLNLQTHEWVSWRMPHKRKGDKNNPGFNLDYSLPKTHPPSHN